MTIPSKSDQRFAAFIWGLALLAIIGCILTAPVHCEEPDMQKRTYSRAQEDADAAVAGRDVNAERKARRDAGDQRSGGERAAASAREAYDKGKSWITDLFNQSKTEHHDKSPGSTKRKP